MDIYAYAESIDYAADYYDQIGRASCRERVYPLV